MRWKQILLMLFIVAILAVNPLFYGCTNSVSQNSSLEDRIIGKWQLVEYTGDDLNLQAGETLQYEFIKGGNLIASGQHKDSIFGKLKPFSVAGNYEFIDHNRIRFDSGTGNAEIDTVAISGNEMVLTDPNGVVAKFRKIQ